VRFARACWLWRLSAAGLATGVCICS
jgi:hypothetical protein